MQKRLFSCARSLRHENPLGLPRSGTPPNLAARMKRGLPERRPIRDVKKVVAVSSAKGGVGKSTIAVNLALSFARLGLRSGILDTDIFGPSVPTLLDLSGEPRLSDNNQLIPLTNYGLKSMSMGYLVPESSAIVWRGLMVMKALQQLLHEVDWDGLDVLVLDLPPGTGDVQLTITQQVQVDGALIVSTPQDVALKDAVRGVEMFRKVQVPILGMVQNMSAFTCPTCNSTHSIFGRDGVTKKCTELGIELVADLPLHPRICEDADRGKPTVVAEPESTRAKAFMDLARSVRGKLEF
ncbi:nucleotide-binding protein 1 [Myriangium duriaei CBS 260.36]|uniref:Nucleotide-binding protein 1 n=1 Tax=Myriangium duriaei CBS 260.36 TaxID=1168546 RepID=A0A9P4IYS4_9PEZI|nr:nucleotide-binding protein 1 [Myriangium duriaei CBS 260.36]